MSTHESLMDDAQFDEVKLRRQVEEIVLEKHDQEYNFASDEKCPITKVKTDGFIDYEIFDKWSKSMVRMFKRRK